VPERGEGNWMEGIRNIRRVIGSKRWRLNLGSLEFYIQLELMGFGGRRSGKRG
jgi:hypothetical protein